MKIEIELNEYDYHKLLKISSHNKLSKEDYAKLIVIRNLDNNVYLKYGYEYDLNKKVLTYNNELIILSNSETQLLELLIKNVDKYVSSDEIIEYIVTPKKMSIFSMRNLIKKLRDKTCKDLIIVKSNIGYRINKLNID